MDRRNFIKTGCALCAGVAGAGFIAAALSGCAALPMFKGDAVLDKINVPISNFKDGNVLIVRNKQLPFDILLVKRSENEVKALQMKCSHQENPLTATKKGLFCPAHGSTFDLEGNVTKEPALSPLKKYKTEVKEQTITIDLRS